MTNTYTLPTLSGNLRGGRRVFTRDHGVTFDELTKNYPHAATVVLTGWSTSYSSLCRALSSPEVVAQDDRKVTLSLRRMENGVWVNHSLNGVKYDSRHAARRAAFDAGALGVWVYENDRLGLEG